MPEVSVVLVFFGALYFLGGIAEMINRFQKLPSATKKWKYLVLLGIVLMAVGFVGMSAFK